ncbi:MAG TPA: branched-chain amino acid ABC transporter permease [Anaerolineales bacterium]|nr:branched-chain amino acid ABC transporter permease [Anaerolineales bacterium]
MENLINAIVSGMISGSLYAIMALGLSILYGVSRVFNFGHGTVALVGAYIVWWMSETIGAGFAIGVILSFVALYFFGLTTYRYAIKPLIQKPGWDISTVLFMLGAGILLENIVLQVFGPRVKSIPVLFEGKVNAGFLEITWHEVILIVVAVCAVIVLNLFFKYSTLGQSMQAVAQSIPGARVVGIDIDYVYGLTFGLAFAVTGFSGILLGTKYFLNPHIGWEWMVKGFVIVTFGGLGSTTGAIYAAFILGVVEAVATLYLGAIWVWPLWFAMFLVVLLVRPRGILGGRN